MNLESYTNQWLEKHPLKGVILSLKIPDIQILQKSCSSCTSCKVKLVLSECITQQCQNNTNISHWRKYRFYNIFLQEDY